VVILTEVCKCGNIDVIRATLAGDPDDVHYCEANFKQTLSSKSSLKPGLVTVQVSPDRFPTRRARFNRVELVY